MAEAATKERLIEAAVRLLAEGAPQAVSLRAVAREAGANSALVSYYFGGLDALLRAAQDRAAAGLCEAAAEADPEELTRALLERADLIRAAFAPLGDGQGPVYAARVAKAMAGRLPKGDESLVEARRMLAWAVFRAVAEGAASAEPGDDEPAVERAFPAGPVEEAVRPRRRSEFID